MMQRYYSVAGHIFSIKLPTNSPLWGRMTPCQPFECESCLDTIFSLESSTETIPVASEQIGRFEGEMVDLLVERTTNGMHMIKFSEANQKQSTTLMVDTDSCVAKIWLSSDQDIQFFGLNNSLMLLYTLFTSSQDTLLLHSSVVMIGNRAYMFQGRSGTGKSTHSRMWIENIEGTKLLNDDNPVIRIQNGKTMIFGTPWSGKTPCYRNLGVELGAVVRIVQAPENRITELVGVRSFASLLPSCSSIAWDKEMQRGMQTTVGRVIETTACYQMECLPNAEAARVCHQKVVR